MIGTSDRYTCRGAEELKWARATHHSELQETLGGSIPHLGDPIFMPSILAPRKLRQEDHQESGAGEMAEEKDPCCHA